MGTNGIPWLDREGGTVAVTPSLHFIICVAGFSSNCSLWY